MSIDTDDIIIAESSHRPAPTYWQRIKQVAMSVLMGMVFVQVLLFAFRMVSIAYYFLTYTKVAIAYLLSCGILGWFYGDRFIQTLGKKSEEWWNLWEYWK